MRIFITGIAGFVGSHLADRLIAEGHEVVGIDNLLTGRLDNVPSKALFFNADIVDYGSSMIHREQPDIVIHAAASYDNPLNHERNIRTNALGSKIIADACFDARVKKLVYFQTSLCYGRPQERPITLNHPIAPICSYAITKTAGEFFIRSGHTPYLIFRLANIYGPRNLSGPISIFYKNIKAGKQSAVSDTRRDYVYIDDLIDLVMTGIDRGYSGIYHAASDTDIWIEDLYNKLESIMGLGVIAPLKVAHGPGDIEHLFLASALTRKAFDWETTVSYEEGLVKAVEWYDTHEFGKSYTHLKEFA